MRRDLARGLVLGLMSGTSADGLSLALVEARGGGLRVLAHEDRPYARSLRERILAAAEARAPELCRLDFALGRLYAEEAAGFLRRRGVPARRLEAVGSHGQTVVHLPRDRAPSTLQIGEASFLAERLGVPVFSDFRPRDMAAGGQGAPLVPFFDEYLFGDGPPRLLQNIGGIGNVSRVGRGARTLAFDTGPGNCLLDLATRRVTGGRLGYDKDGCLARGGEPDRALARSWLRHPYFARRPPKSLDRSEFAEAFLESRLGRRLRLDPRGALATLAYFTALSIADAYQRHLPPRPRPREVVVSGGGALNPALMGHLRGLLSPLPARSIAELGIPPLAKEPAAIALMALLAARGRINHCPRATGARSARVLGKRTI